MMSYIYKQFFPVGTAANFGYAAVLVIMTAIILGIITVIYLKTTRRGADIY
jgi:raffinose/stachyose/melibiose transport system permease protein